MWDKNFLPTLLEFLQALRRVTSLIKCTEEHKSNIEEHKSDIEEEVMNLDSQIRLKQNLGRRRQSKSP
jgi:hypothetical protein